MLLYLSTGTLGYVAFRSRTEGDVLLNLPQTPATDVARRAPERDVCADAGGTSGEKLCAVMDTVHVAVYSLVRTPPVVFSPRAPPAYATAGTRRESGVPSAPLT